MGDSIKKIQWEIEEVQDYFGRRGDLPEPPPVTFSTACAVGQGVVVAKVFEILSDGHENSRRQDRKNMNRTPMKEGGLLEATKLHGQILDP